MSLRILLYPSFVKSSYIYSADWHLLSTKKETMEMNDLYYEDKVAPFLPPEVLDFHTHTWSSENWKERPWDTEKEGGRYMVTDAFYPPEKLLKDGRSAFPDRKYEAVCFGYPTPAVDWEKDTAFVSAAAREHSGLWPLLLAGPALELSRGRYEEALDAGGFYGIKVMGVCT